jgi:GFO/IDH/MocA C-terminal domain
MASMSVKRTAAEAGELVQSGEVGEVIQTLSMGPHRLSLHSRPEWFFVKEQYGGILMDIGSHNFGQFFISRVEPGRRLCQHRSQISTIRWLMMFSIERKRL